MERREFVVSSALGSLGVVFGGTHPMTTDMTTPSASRATRKILIAGGNYNTSYIRYMAELTGKKRPKILYLPTASADSDTSIVGFYKACAPLDVEPLSQKMYIESLTQKQSWEDVILGVDGIVASGGNTLNQQAIWHAQGIAVLLRRAWDQGIVLGGASAGSLCWFEEGTTDSRPQQLSIVKCLGFIPGSHSPHYDAEAGRRPLYQRLISSGQMKPGYACDNDAGIYFEDTQPKRFVSARQGAKVYYVSMVNGQINEKTFEPDPIA
jgi:peptidase E